MANKKVLITGSCGFIFGNFLRKAVYEKQPYQLVSIDRVNKNAINSMYWNKNHTFHVADIQNQHIIDTIFQFEKPNIVIHGAAETSVDESLVNSNSYINSNVLGTQVIINACVKHNVEKLVYISSDQVYGQLTDENKSWVETDCLNPRNPYSSSKAAAELFVKAAYESYGLKYNIARLSNNYGPRQTSDKLIPKVIKSILDESNITIYGEGLQIRDWTHVYDTCSALMTIVNNGIDNEVYNISSSQELSNLEVIQKICNAMSRGYNLMEHISDPRSSHDFRYSMNSSKIKELGWKPIYKFTKGIVETIEWYKINQWFLK